jgi:molybdenum cofactor cytidylyltransferase
MKAIILAAGLSKRMETQKLLLPFAGAAIIHRVMNNVLEASFEQTILVTSAKTAAHMGLEDSGIKGLRILINENPENGQSSSLRMGMEPLCSGEDFCVFLGDMPLVSPSDIRAHVEIFYSRDGGFSALVPFRHEDGALGHPAFFSSIWRERFLEARGDAGGRGVMSDYDAELLKIPAPSCFFDDVDTPEDYLRLTGEFHRRGPR